MKNALQNFAPFFGLPFLFFSCHKTRKLDKVNLKSELRKLKWGN